MPQTHQHDLLSATCDVLTTTKEKKTKGKREKNTTEKLRGANYSVFTHSMKKNVLIKKEVKFIQKKNLNFIPSEQSSRKLAKKANYNLGLILNASFSCCF